LLKLWKKAKKVYKNTELAAALTRFDDSYSRIKPEDKLIDYWVALEALFFSVIPKEYVSTMGDTVASNIAYYIGKTESERRSIYASIIASHKMRGFLVHGQRGTSPSDLNVVLRKTEQHLQQALRKRIEE
jgi:Apea-like HEPN